MSQPALLTAFTQATRAGQPRQSDGAAHGLVQSTLQENITPPSSMIASATVAMIARASSLFSVQMQNPPRYPYALLIFSATSLALPVICISFAFWPRLLAGAISILLSGHPRIPSSGGFLELARRLGPGRRL